MYDDQQLVKINVERRLIDGHWMFRVWSDDSPAEVLIKIQEDADTSDGKHLNEFLNMIINETFASSMFLEFAQSDLADEVK
jgi:hypothetical protein